MVCMLEKCQRPRPAGFNVLRTVCARVLTLESVSDLTLVPTVVRFVCSRALLMSVAICFRNAAVVARGPVRSLQRAGVTNRRTHQARLLMIACKRS
jgi:hypothetical protein